MPDTSASNQFDLIIDHTCAEIAGIARRFGGELPTNDALVVDRRVDSARSAEFAVAEPNLDPLVRGALDIPHFWTHQAEALDYVLSGRSTIVTSGTASGKSMIAWAAIGQAMVGPRPVTALVLHPTKALGHDQFRHLVDLELPGVIPGVYDGDASETERVWVRRNANVLFTNPDMVHVGILPRHAQWATFLRRLRYVVVDEAHTLRGIFGSHVAHVLRRLRRLCQALGSDPVFLFASATVGQADKLAAELCGIDDIAWVANDGSPRGERLLATINPPLIDADTGARVSQHQVTAVLAAQLIRRDLRTIVFCRSRHGAETLAGAIRNRVDDNRANAVQAYRAGYLADERRTIETALASGQLLGVVATNALELGIDIGGLDACIVHGFPGTIASFRQQIGRVGRANDASFAALVAGNDQLDQYLCSHPGELTRRAVEPVIINVANPHVLDPQLLCAAGEDPLDPSDERYWGDELNEGILRCVRNDTLRIQHVDRVGEPAAPRAVLTGHGHPASRISLRSGSGQEIQIRDETGVLIGTVDAARATATLYPGACYLHRGEPFRVTTLDFQSSTAIVEADDGTTLTRADASTEISFIDIDEQRRLGPISVNLSTVAVRSAITGYTRIDIASGQTLEHVPLMLPPESLVTRGFSLIFPEDFLGQSQVERDALPGALHALEHAAIAMLPLFAICDRWDVGGLSTPWHPELSGATVTIFDGYPGGAGIAELGFASIERHLVATLDMLTACPCTSGCPSCVQSPKCGNGNEPLDKATAIVLAQQICRQMRRSR